MTQGCDGGKGALFALFIAIVILLMVAIYLRLNGGFDDRFANGRGRRLAGVSRSHPNPNQPQEKLVAESLMTFHPAPKRCLNCKNHAKLDSDYCSPCKRLLNSGENTICSRKGCKNRTKKYLKYCGLHSGKKQVSTTPKYDSKKSKSNQESVGNRIIECTKCGDKFNSTKIMSTTGATSVGALAGAVFGSVLNPVIAIFAAPTVGAYWGVKSLTKSGYWDTCPSCRGEG